MFTVVSENSNIPVRQLQDGQVAVVVSWGSNIANYIGRVVQRFGDHASDVRPLGKYLNIWHSVRTEHLWEILSVGDSITLVVRADGGLTALQSTAIR